MRQKPGTKPLEEFLEQRAKALRRVREARRFVDELTAGMTDDERQALADRIKDSLVRIVEFPQRRVMKGTP
jgi:hypothetical protein